MRTKEELIEWLKEWEDKGNTYTTITIYDIREILHHLSQPEPYEEAAPKLNDGSLYHMNYFGLHCLAYWHKGKWHGAKHDGIGEELKEQENWKVILDENGNPKECK